MTRPESSANAPWWRRRRGAIDTAVALLVVPAVIGIALAAGGAFDGDDSPSVKAGAPEVQGPGLSAATVSASGTPTPTSTTPVPSTAAPTTAPTTPAPAPTTLAPTTVPPTTVPPTTVPPMTLAPTPAPTTVAPAPKPTASPTASPRPPPVAAPTKPTPTKPTPTKPTPTKPDTAVTGKAPAPTAGSGFLVGKGQVSVDLKTWQTQMSERGWHISADGVFGSQTLRVLKSFQAEKGLSVDGVLGLQSWTAAWTAPVT